MNSGGSRGSHSRSSDGGSSSGGATDDVFVGVATLKSSTLRAEDASLKSGSSIREDGDSGGGGEEMNNPHGQLGWIVTGLIIVGDLAGGGIVALPMAIVQTGMIVGMISLVATTLLSTFTAYLIGRTWSLLREAWPEEYKELHTRKPYAEIGMRAAGSRMRTFVSLNINLTQFGISVVYFLLSSKNIQNIVKAFFDADIPYCIIIFALAIFMLPITFLKSPNDFWWAIVIAMITTTIAVVLVITGAMLDYDKCEKSHSMPPFRVGNFLLGLGTLLFSYGGHAAFPTIQHDMRRPEDFTKSTVFAFGLTFLLYAPIAIAGVVTYGDSIRDAIISSVQIIGLQQAVNILITAHLILALAIIINPMPFVPYDIPFLLSCLYIPPLVALYLIELFIIFRNRSGAFRSGFFILFTFGGIVDIALLFCVTVSFRMPITPFLNALNLCCSEQDWLTKNCYKMAHYLLYSEEYNVLAIALNRFVAVMWPTTCAAGGNRHLRRQRLVALCCVAVASAAPLLTTWPVYLFPVAYLPYKHDTALFYNVKLLTIVPQWIRFMLNSSVIAIATVLSFALNALMARKLMQRSRDSQQRLATIERRLAYLSIGHFLINMPIIVDQAMKAVMGRFLDGVGGFLTASYGGEIRTLAPPLLLLFLCRAMQTEIAAIFRPRTTGDATATRLVTISNNSLEMPNVANSRRTVSTTGNR